MKTTYYEEDDILVLTFADRPVSREVSQDWNVNLSYDAEGNIIEVVILDAKASGLFPAVTQPAQAA